MDTFIVSIKIVEIANVFFTLFYLNDRITRMIVLFLNYN